LIIFLLGLCKIARESEFKILSEFWGFSSLYFESFGMILGCLVWILVISSESDRKWVRVDLKHWPFIAGGVILDLIICDCYFVNKNEKININVGVI
jgi:hypothetical protein